MKPELQNHQYFVSELHLSTDKPELQIQCIFRLTFAKLGLRNQGKNSMNSMNAKSCIF